MMAEINKNTSMGKYSGNNPQNADFSGINISVFIIRYTITAGRLRVSVRMCQYPGLVMSLSMDGIMR